MCDRDCLGASAKGHCPLGAKGTREALVSDPGVFPVGPAGRNVEPAFKCARPTVGRQVSDRLTVPPTLLARADEVIE
jgi:hypothetical protein